MSRCFVCGVEHVVEEPAHKMLTDLYGRVGSVEAKLRELTKPAYPAPPQTDPDPVAAPEVPAPEVSEPAPEQPVVLLEQPVVLNDQVEPQGV